MSDVVLACAMAFAAFVVHVALWQIRVPQRTTRALAVIFAAGLLITLGIRCTWLLAFDWGGGLYVAALYGALALCYLLLYTGIECDSPTLSLADFIAKGGAQGVAKEELDKFIELRPFVLSRISQLEQAGLVIRRRGTLELTPNSLLMLNVGYFHRRLMGRLADGG